MRILIKQSKRNSQWRVYFVAANGRQLVFSEQYINKADAVKVAKLVKTGFVDCEIEIVNAGEK